MKPANRRRSHGASVSAPEERFAPSESPLPGPVHVDAVPNEPTGGSRVLRGLRWILGAVLVIGTALGVAVSAERYALSSPRFGVKELKLSGAQRLTSARVRDLAGLSDTTNLFALDLAGVEASLLKDPWLGSVRVTRRLPSTLEVTVTEREARAITPVNDGLYLVSKQGEPFKQIEAGDPVDLPVITGLSPERLQRDRSRELDRLSTALDVIAQYERLTLSRIYPLEEVHLTDGGAISITLGKEGVVVHLGAGELRQRLLMAERVIDETRRAGRLPGIVFADNQAHPERVVVRMR